MAHISWGCCEHGSAEDKYLVCSVCKYGYHFACVSIDEKISKSAVAIWRCAMCHGPKPTKNDDTPVRNVNTTRGNKNTSISPIVAPVTREEVQDILQDTLDKKINEMMLKFQQSIPKLLDIKLEPLKRELTEIATSMNNLNTQYEEIKRENIEIKEINAQLQTEVKTLKKENSSLHVTISDMNIRLNNVEQNSRSNNIELQCVPESKSENLIHIAIQLGKVVGCKINENDVLHCTRVAKFDRSSDRSRSIVIQLSSVRLRDQLLASSIAFNKKNPENKLNSGHIGLKSNVPIFVMEHLSSFNKGLHAAARQKAKELNYKYVWVRNGRIFMRQSDNSSYILIKNKQALDKLAS